MALQEPLLHDTRTSNAMYLRFKEFLTGFLPEGRAPMISEVRDRGSLYIVMNDDSTAAGYSSI